MSKNKELEAKLKVGTRIKIGEQYNEEQACRTFVTGEVITLVEARKAIIAWGINQEPRDAALALMAVDIINEEYEQANIKA